MSSIRHSDADPYAGELLLTEIELSVESFNNAYQFLASMDEGSLSGVDDEMLTESVDIDNFFAPETDELQDKNALMVLDDIATKLSEVSAMKIFLEADSENQQLYYNRIQAVKNYLTREGISNDRIQMESLSEEDGEQTEI